MEQVAVCQRQAVKAKCIRMLQQYKSAWARLLGHSNFTLEFDTSKQEIVLRAYSAGSVIRKDAVRLQKYRAFWNDLRHLIPSLLIIHTVEKWLKMLTAREAEAVFWRYVNHNWERVSIEDEEDTMLRYKTLSYAEIAEIMRIDKARVARLCQAALRRIVRWMVMEEK